MDYGHATQAAEKKDGEALDNIYGMHLALQRLRSEIGAAQNSTKALGGPRKR